MGYCFKLYAYDASGEILTDFEYAGSWLRGTMRYFSVVFVSLWDAFVDDTQHLLTTFGPLEDIQWFSKKETEQLFNGFQQIQQGIRERQKEMSPNDLEELGYKTIDDFYWNGETNVDIFEDIWKVVLRAVAAKGYIAYTFG